MAATDITFQGLYFALGYTVQVSICGLDCGDYVVGGVGQIVVPINSDPNQLCNGAYLVQFDVGPYDRSTYGDATTRIDLADGVGGVETIYVPVVIGFTYPSMGMGLRPDSADQVKSPQGGGLGKTRRVHWAGMLFNKAQGVSVMTSNGQMYPTTFTASNEVALPMNQLFSGVWAGPVPDIDSYDGILGWMVTRPYACTVVSMNSFLETRER